MPMRMLFFPLTSGDIMEWLSENLFFVLFLLLFIGLHLFGHGMHGGHGNHGTGRPPSNPNDVPPVGHHH